MKKVQAKFECNSKIEYNYGTVVTFHAVYGEGKENLEWSKLTPSGSLSMVINKEKPAADFFTQGAKYYLTFEIAE